MPKIIIHLFQRVVNKINLLRVLFEKGFYKENINNKLKPVNINQIRMIGGV